MKLEEYIESIFGCLERIEYVVRTGYYIGNNLKTNKRYTMVGYMYPEPTADCRLSSVE